MAQPNKPPKTMSSRLMDMKFMQRAAASSPSASPGTPSEPSLKRQRLSNGTYNTSSPSRPVDDQSSENLASSEHLKGDEKVEFEGADRGETKWYLSVAQRSSTPRTTPLRVVSAGFGTLDATNHASASSEEDENDANGSPQIRGRRSFGNFNRRTEKQQEPKAVEHETSSASDSSSSEDGEVDNSDEGKEEDSDDPTGLRAMLAEAKKKASDKAQARREHRRTKEGAEAARLATERRKSKKRVKLNESASGSDPPPRKPRGPCFKCGKMGHLGVYCAKSVLSLDPKGPPR